MAVEDLSSALPLQAGRWHRDRRFFVGMVALAVVIIFVGFAPTYYLKAAYGTPALPLLVHVHGLLFTSWMLLLVGQTSLVAARRTDLHRRVGVGGGVLAGLMTIVAFQTAIGAVRREAMEIGFLIFPMGSVLVFPALVGAALYFRRQPDIHKRLMLIATAELLSAGVGRWPIVRDWGPWGFFGVTDLLVLGPIVVYDLVVHRRIHHATLWGGLLFIASQSLRLAIAGTEGWLAVARWLVG